MAADPSHTPKALEEHSRLILQYSLAPNWISELSVAELASPAIRDLAKSCTLPNGRPLTGPELVLLLDSPLTEDMQAELTALCDKLKIPADTFETRIGALGPRLIEIEHEAQKKLFELKQKPGEVPAAYSKVMFIFFLYFPCMKFNFFLSLALCRLQQSWQNLFAHECALSQKKKQNKYLIYIYIASAQSKIPSKEEWALLDETQVRPFGLGLGQPHSSFSSRLFDTQPKTHKGYRNLSFEEMKTKALTQMELDGEIIISHKGYYLPQTPTDLRSCAEAVSKLPLKNGHEAALLALAICKEYVRHQGLPERFLMGSAKSLRAIPIAFRKKETFAFLDAVITDFAIYQGHAVEKLLSQLAQCPLYQVFESEPHRSGLLAHYHMLRAKAHMANFRREFKKFEDNPRGADGKSGKKTKLTDQKKKRQPCRYWVQNGHCRNGSACRWPHPPALRGTGTKKKTEDGVRISQAEYDAWKASQASSDVTPKSETPK